MSVLPVWFLRTLGKGLKTYDSRCALTPSNELLSLLFNYTKSPSGLTHFLAPTQREDYVRMCAGLFHCTQTSHLDTKVMVIVYKVK